MVAGAVIEFKVQTPVSDLRLLRNVAWSRPRYPDVSQGPPRCATLNIIASGPSARSAPLSHLGPTMALNGSLGLFREAGLTPTWWAACDPQVLVSDFLRDPPPETIYLAASKCDRTVFRALRGHQVRLWHLDDVDAVPWAVPVATTITLTAIPLAVHMGFRRIDIWGWDGCYLDGLDHACPQPHDTAHNVSVEVGRQTFHTTASWALEAQEAVYVVGQCGARIRIHGPGMIATILHHLRPELCETPDVG